MACSDIGRIISVLWLRSEVFVTRRTYKVEVRVNKRIGDLMHRAVSWEVGPDTVWMAAEKRMWEADRPGIEQLLNDMGTSRTSRRKSEKPRTTFT
jgi:hypothetical protein